jgi:hypothetical protein
MSDANPFKSPSAADDPTIEAVPSSLTVAAGFFIVFVSGATGALLGVLAGISIGAFAPAYYHAVFNDPTLNSVQVGAGLGFTQGLTGGIGIACVVLLSAAIWNRGRTMLT